MKYSKLELDLSGLTKADTCYVLDQSTVGLAPALATAGVPFVAIEADSQPAPVLRGCAGQGQRGLTNLESPPENWAFTDDRPLEIALGRVSIRRAEGTEEERFVYGEVLIPDWVDTHGTTISETVVRQTSHEYMVRFQQIGLNHDRLVTGKVVVLESYIAPVDFELAGSTIRRGTWMMGVRVLDDTLWGKIKAGELTGFSIGGWGSIEAR